MPPAPLTVRAFVRRLLGATRGATAVEFAMIGLPFVVILCSIFELGMMFMTSTTIEATTEAAARQIRTGQLQAGASNSAAGFKTLICNGMSWISTADCMANMSVDVQTYSSFSAMTNTTPPIANGAIDQTQLTFNPGASCSIELVQVFYPYTLITPVLEPGLPNLGSNQRLLTTAMAFRNEDWQANGAPCS
jgi:Flp pilus assembly protein TadG